MAAELPVRDGWLIVPYTGSDLARVHVAVGNEPQVWQPAFLDWVEGQRVAKVRARNLPERAQRVWLRVGDEITQAGTVRRT